MAIKHAYRYRNRVCWILEDTEVERQAARERVDAQIKADRRAHPILHAIEDFCALLGMLLQILILGLIVYALWLFGAASFSKGDRHEVEGSEAPTEVVPASER